MALPAPSSPSLSVNQYLLTKARQGSSTLSALLFIFQDVIRARSEMSRSLQGKYLCECQRESHGEGGGVKRLFFSALFFTVRTADIRPRMIPLPAAISVICYRGCFNGAESFSMLKEPLNTINTRAPPLNNRLCVTVWTHTHTQVSKSSGRLQSYRSDQRTAINMAGVQVVGTLLRHTSIFPPPYSLTQDIKHVSLPCLFLSCLLLSFFLCSTSVRRSRATSSPAWSTKQKDRGGEEGIERHRDGGVSGDDNNLISLWDCG